MQVHEKTPKCIGALCYIVRRSMKEITVAIIPQTSMDLTNDRIDLTPPAMFLFSVMATHAVGNLHVVRGPNDSNGHGYFYLRLYPSGHVLPAYIVGSARSFGNGNNDLVCVVCNYPEVGLVLVAEDLLNLFHRYGADL